jgi:hypothetical protein
VKRPPPEHWRAHVAVDVCAIAAITALALLRVISGELALAAILAVQGVYLVQLRNPPPGGPGAALALMAAVRRLL